jgi:ubiquinone/menaquinone biosynthesis C-methylase UbiE
MKQDDQQIKRVMDTFNLHATAYEEKFMDLGNYEPSLKIFSNLLPKGKCSLFEIGCGPGNITKFLFQRNEQLDILAIDIAESMVEIAKKNVRAANFKVMDCRDIKRIKLYFNAVVCGFCLPYLNADETKRLIEDMSRLLLPGGWLYLSALAGDYSQSRPYGDSRKLGDPVMTYFHEKDKLLLSLKASGFVLIMTELLPQKHQYEASQGDLIVIAKKAEK